MKWSAPLAALFLALGYVHYAFIAELGGSPAFVVGWLILFVATAGVAITQTLVRWQRPMKQAIDRG